MHPYGARKSCIRIGLLSKSGCHTYGALADTTGFAHNRRTHGNRRSRHRTRSRARRLAREEIQAAIDRT